MLVKIEFGKGLNQTLPKGYSPEAQKALDNFLLFYFEHVKKRGVAFYKICLGRERERLAVFETGHRDAWQSLGELGGHGQELLATLLEHIFIGGNEELLFVPAMGTTGTWITYAAGDGGSSIFNFSPVRLKYRDL